MILFYCNIIEWLTKVEAAILNAVRKMDEPSGQEVARAINASSYSHVTNTLSKLSDRELLEREKLEDDRTVNHTLTHEGREIARNVEKIVNHLEA